MPTLLSARSRARRIVVGGGGGGGGGDEDGSAVGSRVCYGIAASAVTLLLFCALAASVSVWMALAFAGLAMAALVLAACVAPQSWLVGTSGGGGGGGGDSVSDERVAAAAGRAAQRRFGMPEAAINALPTFAYELKGDGAGEVDLESGAAAGEPCSVCLEDLQAGEMVRQLPACSHLFHVGCIDMWLHTHRTCPLCRCNLLPPPRVPGKAAAAPAPAAEAEPPAGDALPPV